MPEIGKHMSVTREIEAIKEAVAFKAVAACVEWLRDHDEPEIAEKLAREMLEVEQDGD